MEQALPMQRWSSDHLSYPDLTVVLKIYLIPLGRADNFGTIGGICCFQCAFDEKPEGFPE
jgi:hypothetical protein